jgi:hypothetical protein
MTNNSFTDSISLMLNLDVGIWGLVKAGILVGLFLYLGFAVMIVRQVDLMSRSLDSQFNRTLKTLARLYFLLTVFVFLAAIVSL